jgi:hypothetical protein
MRATVRLGWASRWQEVRATLVERDRRQIRVKFYVKILDLRGNGYGLNLRADVEESGWFK